MIACNAYICYRFHVIVTAVSPKRDRDFTESVTD